VNEKTPPNCERVYRNWVFDSTRWRGFEPRNGDVIVAPPYKTGTTWLQMMCALLIHGSANLPAPLGELSPWLDFQGEPVDDVLANYRNQTFRRIVKTHTPLDGLPYYKEVDYIFCGRAPLDVFMSMQNHLANLNIERNIKLLKAQGIDPGPMPLLPDDVNERFALWMSVGGFEWEKDGAPLWSLFRHTETFWNHRSLKNIHFFHYADLKNDLPGEMRRLAGVLGVEVDEASWGSLVDAATFKSMKARADQVAPDVKVGVWRDNQKFFNRGENEQWRGVLNEESVKLYREHTRRNYDPAMIAWLEQGAAAV
jgi:aryl sulfotransferase